MKTGVGQLKPEWFQTKPGIRGEQVMLYRTGKLGLGVRAPGRRLPKSTVQQLFRRADFS